MIFYTPISNAKAAKDYYAQHLAPGDYYAKETAELKGIWHGRGAEMLGISGEVNQKDYFRLCDNINPKTGEQLTPRTKEDRRVLMDFTFDAPKSVTLAYELGGDERILESFRTSMHETMAEIEDAAQVRVRKDGAFDNRDTGNMIWSEHIHRTGRPVDGVVDPQMHCHTTVFNASYDATEARWKAIELGVVVRDKGYYQAAFHARFAARLKDLGYGIERDGNSFRLAGISRDTVEKFSRRSEVIDAEAEKRGIDDPAQKSQLGRKTREKKSKTQQSMAQLRNEWDGRLTAEERLALASARQGWDKGDDAITPEQAKEYALAHSFERASAVSEKTLKEEALKYAVGSVKPQDVANMAQHKEVIAETRGGQLWTTTKTVLKNEVAFLQFAKDGQRKQKPFVSVSNTDVNKPGGFVSESLAGLSGEQHKAALHVLTSRDTVTGVVGKAGTGKTTMMRTTRDAIESEPGRDVYAFAPSSQASRGVLAKEGFKDATTLETLLQNEKMQEKVKGQVIWVDEAGQVSSGDMKRLMDVVKKGDNRLILSGDYTQHSSVEAGDAFRLLEKEAGVKFARLTEVRRQTEPGYKKAVEAISQGSGKAAQKGFDALDKMGCVIEAGKEERHGLLVKDYLKAQEEGRSALIIAPTHAEGQKLTDELRMALKERGALGKEHSFIARKSTGWTDAQKGDSRNYEPGMVVEFNQNAKGFRRGERAVVGQGDNGLYLQKQDGTKADLPVNQAKRFEVYRSRELSIAKGDRIRITRNGEAKVEGQAKGTRISNGDIFTVHGFTKEGDIRLDKGKILPKGWGHMSMGYVDTSYASQGKTVDRVFIAVGNQSLAAANQQQWYVSASRGREMAKVYVEDKQEVRDAIARTGQRLSAVELTKTKLRPSWRSRFYESLERNRVGRFLKNRADAIAGYWRDRGQQRGLSYG